MYAYKDLLELAGLTTRVYTLISTLHALPPVRDFVVDEDKIALYGVSICVPERTVRGEKHDVLLDDSEDHLGLSGTDGSLVEPLRLVIKRGEHLMITGPVCSYQFLAICAFADDVLCRMVLVRRQLHACSGGFGKLSEGKFAARRGVSTDSLSFPNVLTWS
jgi:hypothetical protein